ncbi:MAG: VanZ family protein [Clostridiales bacterium]|nr:VanZ family protein [Clostridiales bacterium]
MIKHTTKSQRLGWILFLVYLGLLIYLMFFAESLGRDPGRREYAYNLELFKEIRRFYRYRHQLGMEAFLLNVFGNVIGFMPCGFFLPVISRGKMRCRSMILLCFGFSLCIETAQLILRVGSFDVDDLLLNTLGGALGYLAYRLVGWWYRRRSVRAEKS